MSGYTVETPGQPGHYLQPGDRGLHALGVIRRPDGARGALVRTAAGRLVQANAGTFRSLPQREAEAALAAALAGGAVDR